MHILRTQIRHIRRSVQNPPRHTHMPRREAVLQEVIGKRIHGIRRQQVAARRRRQRRIVARAIRSARIHAKVVPVDGRDPRVAGLVAGPRDGRKLVVDALVLHLFVRGAGVRARGDGSREGRLLVGADGEQREGLGWLARRVGGQQVVGGGEARNTRREVGTVRDGVIGGVKVAAEAVDLAVGQVEAVGEKEGRWDREIGAIGACKDERIAQGHVLCCFEAAVERGPVVLAAVPVRFKAIVRGPVDVVWQLCGCELFWCVWDGDVIDEGVLVRVEDWEDYGLAGGL